MVKFRRAVPKISWNKIFLGLCRHLLSQSNTKLPGHEIFTVRASALNKFFIAVTYLSASQPAGSENTNAPTGIGMEFKIQLNCFPLSGTGINGAGHTKQDATMLTEIEPGNVWFLCYTDIFGYSTRSLSIIGLWFHGQATKNIPNLGTYYIR